MYSVVTLYCDHLILSKGESHVYAGFETEGDAYEFAAMLLETPEDVDPKEAVKLHQKTLVASQWFHVVESSEWATTNRKHFKERKRGEAS